VQQVVFLCTVAGRQRKEKGREEENFVCNSAIGARRRRYPRRGGEGGRRRVRRVLERACIMITDILVSLNIIAALLLLAQLLH
jgi:hypothetical protein